ncbi:Acyl-[acyl-carrier-protein] hydrolase [Melia azedarach]|uniref:Acyl-[acyl-carrier-protein] hydrolase n=1 Tax=Melia azedarach TaxID=155640 RepID=A0ACC1Y549_MELAZ|nr:Acyl-[acyl-carrier-protein] hydrolase [Melia azedarach]
MAALFFMTPCSMNMKTTRRWQGKNQSLDGRGNNNKPHRLIPASGLQLKTNIQALPTIDRLSPPAEMLKNKRDQMASTPTTMPQRENIIEQLDMMAGPNSGIMVENGLVFRQYFIVRSFDIGSDFKMSIAALMNYLQETTLNHLKKVGLMADGFGSSAKMSANNLIWVACSSQIELDYYPSWDDVIQVDTWKYRSGKIGVGFDWNVRDSKTGESIIRATRKQGNSEKLSEEIAEEMKPFLKECDPIVHKDRRKLLQMDIDNADHVRTGIMPGWTDMDGNQHVSHIKLINYVLQSVPSSFVENHELSAISLEYRNECNGNSNLQSLSKVTSNNNNHLEY